jgi:hypothetical protein
MLTAVVAFVVGVYAAQAYDLPSVQTLVEEGLRKLRELEKK